MKTTLAFSLLLSISSITFAQTTTSGTVTMNGAELNKMIDQSKDVYDEEGNKVDSLKVVNMLEGKEYRIVLKKRDSDSQFRKIIEKRDLKKEAETYDLIKISLRPASPRLKVGSILDLDPLAKKTNIDALKKKSILMIFWYPNCFDTGDYNKVNDVIRSVKNPENLEILLITHETVNKVVEGLKQTPIFYTKLLIDASSITEAYQTNNMPLLIVTDRNHTINFASMGCSDDVVHGLKQAILEVDKQLINRYLSVYNRFLIVYSFPLPRLPMPLYLFG
ncbi:hypothetical protein [Pedobacter sp. V48]|uniref:hypothetical protein n=1 Tax=Pedobacter sp. V48 TaxID=509635 RepID=UPI0003E47DEF|nr:hypothetical protein [Pedobacter sp. V48]ETZ21942.1 hypothetical protein N824_25935 [Pedobacter sp. V48]